MLVTRSLGLRNLESPGLSLQRPNAASCGADAALPCPFAAPEIPASNKNRNAEKPNRTNRRIITVSPFPKSYLVTTLFWLSRSLVPSAFPQAGILTFAFRLPVFVLLILFLRCPCSSVFQKVLQLFSGRGALILSPKELL